MAKPRSDSVLDVAAAVTAIPALAHMTAVRAVVEACNRQAVRRLVRVAEVRTRCGQAEDQTIVRGMETTNRQLHHTVRETVAGITVRGICIPVLVLDIDIQRLTPRYIPAVPVGIVRLW